MGRSRLKPSAGTPRFCRITPDSRLRRCRCPKRKCSRILLAMRAQQFPELDESNRQAMGAWKRFVLGAPNGEFQEAHGVTCAFGHVPLSFFNMVFLSSPVQNSNDFDERVATARQHGSKCGY